MYASYLDAVDAGVLRNVTILVKAFLDHFSFSQVDAKLNKLKHDGLHDIKCIAARSLRQDNFVQCLQCDSILTGGAKLYRNPSVSVSIVDSFIHPSLPSALLRALSGFTAQNGAMVGGRPIVCALSHFGQWTKLSARRAEYQHIPMRDAIQLYIAVCIQGTNFHIISRQVSKLYSMLVAYYARFTFQCVDGISRVKGRSEL